MERFNAIHKRLQDFSSCARITFDIKLTALAMVVMTSYTHLKHSCSNHSCVDIAACRLYTNQQLSHLFYKPTRKKTHEDCSFNLLRATHEDRVWPLHLL
ncbi:UNVERIFIED_CONTAM: hypothetical protein FKN15_030071 [Acipenser sinensis]